LIPRKTNSETLDYLQEEHKIFKEQNGGFSRQNPKEEFVDLLP
jgi:hypothetical protein